MKHDIDEYIDHEEYTIEEQRYDEGYDNALLWVSLEIGKMLCQSKYETDALYRAQVDALEEEQERNGFYKFQDEMEMWRRER